MPDARARVLSMVDDLRGNPNIEVISVEIGEPAPTAGLEAARALAHGALPAGVEDFYTELNGFTLEWRHSVDEVSHGDLSDHGLINILPIDEVFGDWHGVTWFSEDNDEEFRPVKPFDLFVPEACAAFIQPPGQPPAGTVAYHYFGEELIDTGYSFEEYLARLLAARGFWYWIQTLCADLHSEAVISFRRAMPLIFDDYDDQLFQPR